MWVEMGAGWVRIGFTADVAARHSEHVDGPGISSHLDAVIGKVSCVAQTAPKGDHRRDKAARDIYILCHVLCQNHLKQTVP